jgi:sphingosine kinase
MPEIIQERIFSDRLWFMDCQNPLTANTPDYPLGYLTEKYLIFFHNGQEIYLSLDDVVGVSPCDISVNIDTILFELKAYPLVELSAGFGFGKKRQRQLKTYEFACPNTEVRSRWLVAIQNLIRGLPIDNQNTVVNQRLQIFLNPISGKRQSRIIFQQIRPLLDNSHLEYTLTETTRPGQIKDSLNQINLSEIDGIIIVGGDGSIHEAINGLMNRQDWQTAILKPIGIIPGGTGNGLAKTLLEIAGEPDDPLSAAFLIAKGITQGKYRPLDIAKTTQNGQIYYSFLSLGWGIISDVDIESEKLRFLGSLRTDIYALMRIATLRRYPGKFAYLPAYLPVKEAIASLKSQFQSQSQSQSQSQCQPLKKCPNCLAEDEAILPANQKDWQVIQDEFVLIWAMNISHATQNLKAAPYAHLSDGMMDLIIVRRGISKLNLLLAFLKAAQGKHLSLPGIEFYKVRGFRLEPLTPQGILTVDGEQVEYLPIEMEVKRGLARVICP